MLQGLWFAAYAALSWPKAKASVGPVTCTLFVSTLQVLFEDPVMASDGITYSRAAIEQWLRDHDTSPTTRARLKTNILYPGNRKRLAVSAWLENK